MQNSNSGPRDKYYLWICKRGGAERVEDSLEAEDAGEDGQEGGEGEDSQPQGVSQRHGGHGGGGGPQQHHPTHCYLNELNIKVLDQKRGLTVIPTPNAVYCCCNVVR